MGNHRSTGIFESIQHMTDSFAKVRLTCLRSSAFHWHYDYEIIAVLRGRIEVQYGLYGAEPQKLGPGDVILINSKGVHAVQGIDMDNLCISIQFPVEIFSFVPEGMKYQFFLNSACDTYPSRQSGEYFTGLAAKIAMNDRMQGEEYSLRLKAWLYMLLANLISGVQHELRSAPANREKDMELVMAISGYVDQHLQDDTITEDICREFGLSEKGIYRLLKDVVGLTLKEMIDASRIQKACILLHKEGVSMQLVSDLCGYSGEATFYRRFRSAMGITPGEYRKGVEANVASNEIQDYLSFDEEGAEVLIGYWAGKVENSL
ncbi:MAG: helix-turn-helix domain-containing protein [Eubacteriales bacterium]|nr:helix-turn-helix domain-containing protein [Eubacteriales bacterium]